MNNDPIAIVSAVRTPIGNMLGQLAPLTASELSAITNKNAIERAKIQPNEIDEVILGCVLAAGQGQAPARQAMIKAGIPDRIGATTINKMCGSGMKAVMFAHDLILADSAKIILAGGMESMSNAPYLLQKARIGYRLGHGEIKDHMFLDGLEDAYDKGRLMGYFAEETAKKYHFSREAQDAYATRSLQRAIEATNNHRFAAEIVSVKVPNAKAEIQVLHDEGPDPMKLEKISRLKPAFAADGTVTAANSSSISDGAASLILMRLSEAEKRGCEPLAIIHAHSTCAQAPAWFTTAPVTAIIQVLEKAQWNLSDVDLFEINEAFAVVVMVALQELKLSPDNVNIHGGGCALGHPIGASGARILTTLIYALRQHHLKRGVASLCIGGGEATAMAIEAVY